MRYTVTRVGSSGGLQAPGTQPFPPAGYFFPPSSPSKLSVVFSLRQGSHPTLPFHRASFSLHFGRHYRYLVSCLTAGAKRCVGFGPPRFLLPCPFLLCCVVSKILLFNTSLPLPVLRTRASTTPLTCLVATRDISVTGFCDSFWIFAKFAQDTPFVAIQSVHTTGTQFGRVARWSSIAQYWLPPLCTQSIKA